MKNFIALLFFTANLTAYPPESRNSYRPTRTIVRRDNPLLSLSLEDVITLRNLCELAGTPNLFSPQAYQLTRQRFHLPQQDLL